MFVMCSYTIMWISESAAVEIQCILSIKHVYDLIYQVTGGGDTSIRMWKLQQTENQSESKIQCQSLPFPEKDVSTYLY